MKCFLCSVSCAVFPVQCLLCSVYCAVFPVQCFLCSVYCAVFPMQWSHLNQSSLSFPAAVSVSGVLNRVSVTEHKKLLSTNDALLKVRFYVVFVFVGACSSTVLYLYLYLKMMILVSINDVQSV